MTAINNEIRQHDLTFEQISQNLTESLDLLDDCVAFYKGASDTIKRLMNQAIFEKIYISYTRDVTLDIEAKYNPPFNIIIEPFTKELAKLNHMAGQCTDTAVKQIQAAKNRILKVLRYGLFASSECPDDIETCPTSNFFTDKSCNKTFLVEMMGVEPMSESTSKAFSPSASDDLKFVHCNRPTED